MPRTKSLRSVGLEAWLNEEYADKGGYAKYNAMTLASARTSEIAAHFGVDSRTVNNWKFFADLGYTRAGEIK